MRGIRLGGSYKTHGFLFALLLLSLTSARAHANANIGLNTPDNSPELAIAVQGQVGIDLTDPSVSMPTTSISSTTNPPNVYIAGKAHLVGNTTIGTPANSTTGAPAVQADLAVTGVVQVGTTTASCSNSNAGAIRYNQSSSVLEYCNGTQWQSTMGGSPCYYIAPDVSKGDIDLLPSTPTPGATEGGYNVGILQSGMMIKAVNHYNLVSVGGQPIAVAENLGWWSKFYTTVPTELICNNGYWYIGGPPAIPQQIVPVPGGPNIGAGFMSGG